MVLFLNELFSLIPQYIVFTLIPFVVWTVKFRKKQTFFNWIGLKNITSEHRKNAVLITLAVSIVFSVTSILPLYLTKNIDMASSIFDGLGVDAVPAILVFSFLKTGLSEEILFRGFILKMLAIRLEFNSANIIQGLLFGLLHGILFLPITGILFTVMISLITGFQGWCMGYVNEKKANGSIIPSIVMHGVGNTFSSCLAAFSIF